MDIGIEQRALQTLEKVVELPAQERADYITGIPDRELASRVTELLGALDHLGDADDTQALGFQVASPEQDFVGAQVGSYRIEELVGRGGMGLVYRASRTDGAFERDVAVKFFSTIAPKVLRLRFSAERQLLARLQHPNIASLIDGGSLSIQGQMHPYLVMEYVEGRELDHDPRRSVDDSLQLFQKVCTAVHYAHTQLILHRDLKPANVKLDQTGEPKLLDFGVAKLLETEALSSLTQQLPAAFTFNYTAPEVLGGEPATVVSEVYSLGVYLHVLVHGKTPYDLTGMAYPAMLKQLREAKTQAVPRGSEVDAIIARAMHRDPQRRYSSVAALAEDIARYRSGHPVTARGDDMLYRASRFVRRHALAVGLSAITAVGLSVTTAAAIYQAREARAAQLSTQRTLDFVQSMFSAADPRSGEPLGPDAKLSELLQLAEKLARDSFADDRAGQLAVYLLLAETWLGMEQLDSVQSVLEQSETIFASLGEDVEKRADYAEVIASLRVALAISGTQWRDAVAECAKNAELSTRVAATYPQLSMQIGCANALVNTGQPEQSRQWAQMARRSLAPDNATQLTEYQKLQSHFSLANVFLGLGDFDATVQYMDLAEASAKSLGESGLASLALIYVMKSILPSQQGLAEDSLRYTELALETARASPLSPDQVLYAYIQLYHADRLIEVERLAAAEDVFANAREVLLTRTPDSSHYHATTHYTEYKIAFLAQEYTRAERALLAAKRIRTAGGEANTPWQAASDFGLGRIYLAQQRYVEAEAHIARAHEFFLNMFGPEHPKVQAYAEALADARSHL